MRTFPFTNIGHCIYCDSTEEPLTREHVVAAGLGGNRGIIDEHEALVLQRATCETCREITRKIEEHYLKDTLNLGRNRLELPRKERREASFTVDVQRDEGEWSKEKINFKQMDCALFVPSFRAAKILDPQADGTFDLWVGNTVTAEPMSDPAITRYRYAVNLNVPTFARVLAKIAHGYLVASLGPNGFRPLVREMIQAEPEDYNYLVGGFAPQDNPRDDSLPLHFLAYREEGPYWLVGIQLFAQFGGPMNYVVTGEIL